MTFARTALFASLALGACVYPATEVVVLVGTDVPPDVPLTLTARVVRGAGTDAAPLVHRWTRRAPGASGDAGIALPASFGVVPSRGARDEVVTVVVEAETSRVTLRRTARFAFVRNATLTLPVFLTARCLEQATGCTTPGPCTVALRCEDRGQTCGNDGACVEVPVPLGPDGGALPDAMFGGCGQYGQRCCPVGEACASAMTCVGGRCQRCTDPGEVCCVGGALMANGTACAMPADARCQSAGVCTDGACGAVTNRPDGTMCAPASNPCLQPGVCRAGACQPAAPRPDGTACGAAPDPCHEAPTCAGGVCGAPRNRPDGTPCGAAPDPCHEGSRCAAGRCVAGPALPDGAAWGAGGIQRCCGGSPVSVNTPSNCGACGLSCAAGRPCRQLRGQPQWYCECSASSECWSGCCVTYYGAPWACGASRCTTACIACPGGATCRATNTNPYYCSY